MAVLGAGMLVTLIGLTALASVRIERATVATSADAEQARLYAQSAVELGAQWVRSDPLWRGKRTSGEWVTKRAIGDGHFTLEGIDPVDGDFLNRPTDPLILRATAVRGRARQVVEARLEASGTPLNVLETALYATAELRVRAGAMLTVAGAPAATAMDLRNEGTINGDAECLTTSGSGTIAGSLRVGALPRSLPASDPFSMYTSLATPISPGSMIDRRVLAPGVNPWGDLNPDGVYIIHTNQDLTIRDSRIHGTLIIICPGRTVTIDRNVLFHTARAEYPVLLVQGNLVVRYDSDTELSETALSTNFNPPAAPYEGASNNTTVDRYLSEIRGLVHVRGTLSAAQNKPRIRGMAIVDSALASNSVEIHAGLEIVHDPNLLTNPPMGYMETVSMSVRPRSWRQVTLD